MEEDKTLGLLESGDQCDGTLCDCEFVDYAAGHKPPMTQSQIISDYFQRAEKKAKEQKARRKKKKKGKDDSCSLALVPNMFIEDAGLLGSEIVTDPGYVHLHRSSVLNERIRSSQGRAIGSHCKLKLGEESGVFFGMSAQDGCYTGKSSRLDGHICVIGESGRGKTECIVKPTMLTYQDGSTILFDFKDNLHGHWISTCKWSGKKCRLFWFGAPDGCSCHYDPLASLRRNNSADIVPAATNLAQTLLPLSENVKDPVWVETAQVYLTGVIIYYFHLNLNFPQIMMMVLNKPVTEMIKEIMKDKNEDEDVLAKIFINKLTDVDQKVLSNIGMELSQLTFFATDPGVMDLLTPENDSELLDWYEISTSPEPIDVIISVPESKLEYYKPILRLMGNQLINVLEQRTQRTFDRNTELPPILVLMDEFARLGRFPSITHGLMTLRSAGVTFAIFVQSIASLDEVYGHATARVILDNCTFKVILGASDPESQQYCSNLVGSVETFRGSINESYNFFTEQANGYNRSISTTREPIIYPHEFGTLSDVVLVSPEGYFRVHKVPYYKNKGMFERFIVRPNYKAYMEEYDRTHALSALSEGSDHE